jgi:hypothetical protein
LPVIHGGLRKKLHQTKPQTPRRPSREQKACYTLREGALRKWRRA